MRVSDWLPRMFKTAARRVRFYMGAETSRLMADFNDPMVSADAATAYALRPLRDRARQLERNNPIAQSFLRLCTDNIIGPDGFMPQVSSGDAAINGQIKSAFVEWCRREHCTVDGRASFTEVERLAVARWRAVDGEALIRLWRGEGDFGLRLQILDADVLDETHTRARSGGQNEIRMGVEIDRFDRPVAYHLFTSHPSDISIGRARERVRVPASDIIHLYRQDRPGQTRGVTAFAPVLRDLWQLAGMEHAVLVAQRAAANQMGFLVPTSQDADPLADTRDPNTPLQIEQAPGAMAQLPWGYDVKSWAPAMPTNTYGPFTEAVLLKIAVGLGVTYGSLIGDASAANYGSQRGMLIRERRMWRVDQETIRDAFHEIVFRVWLQQAAIAGRVKLRGADPMRLPVEWLMPTWDWIDPLKDTQGALAEVSAGLNSLTNVAAARGRDLDTILAQRAAEIKKAAELGVPLSLPNNLAPIADPSPEPAASTPTREALRVVRAAMG